MQGGDAGCVAYLLRKGAEVNLQDMRGLSPLHNAAFARMLIERLPSGYTQLLLLLLDRRCSVKNALGRTPLFLRRSRWLRGTTASSPPHLCPAMVRSRALLETDAGVGGCRKSRAC